MRYEITIENTAEVFGCSSHQHLLQGMESLGRRGIPVGCRGGGCGICKVQVTSGAYVKKKMNRAVISEQDESENIVLACRCFPAGELSIKVIGKIEKAVVARRSRDLPTGEGLVSIGK
jgi:ferredoxin